MRKIIVLLLAFMLILSCGSALAKGGSSDLYPICGDCGFGNDQRHAHGKGCSTCEVEGCNGCTCDKNTTCAINLKGNRKDHPKWEHCVPCQGHPTPTPTPTVTPEPTPTVTPEPTIEPTPTTEPTTEPTIEPTIEPTPTIAPTIIPVQTPAPTPPTVQTPKTGDSDGVFGILLITSAAILGISGTIMHNKKVKKSKNSN